MLLFSFSMNFGQSNIAIGEWKSYLPFNTGLYLTQSNEKIFYGTELAVMSIDKDDFTIEYISKVEGLTETGIQDLAYDKYNSQLIIAYQNSIIDIVTEDEVFPIYNIRDTDIFQGDKKIYDIFVQNSEYVYFATGFGVVQYNLEKREFGFTLDASQRVSEIHGSDQSLIMSGDEGAYTLDLSVTTPNFLGSWSRIENGIPESENIQSIMYTNSKFYAATGEAVYLSDDGTTFSGIYNIIDNDHEVVFLEEAGDGWMLGLKDPNFNSKVIFFDASDIPYHEVTDCTNRLTDALMDESGRLFLGDEWEGIRYKNSITGGCAERLFSNTPKSGETSDIDIEDGIVYVASGGVSDNFANLFSRQGFYFLEEGDWQNINEGNTTFLKDNEIIQHYKITAHPRDPVVYIGSFWAGLVAYNREEESFVLYNNSNSPLTEPVGDNPDRVKISGMTFDKDNNLWLSNFGTNKPVAVLTPEGNWHNFEIPGDTRITDMEFDEYGYLWIVVGSTNGGVIVLDPGESIPDPGDSPAPILKNTNNSEMPSNIVNCIARDIDGGMWVGTAAGVILFECGSGIFDNPCDGNKPKVLQDSIAAFLLETEDVLSIAVDGANRKWFGTRNGIFVQSENGEVQVAHFNTENSPLFDNIVKVLEYNPENGEMFIATNKGLQSYRTRSTGAKSVHASSVYAFPNPVRPEHTGVIAIKGLARDAEVKITDISGKLVYQTEALGGQAIWDGRDLHGMEVTGGVYLVFSSSSDGFSDPDGYVTKILLVR